MSVCLYFARRIVVAAMKLYEKALCGKYFEMATREMLCILWYILSYIAVYMRYA